MLGIARYHRDSNGWNDIGYNFLVDKYGQVFEGRAGGIDAPVIGAQAQGYNSVSTGVACLGTFTEIAQSEPGMDALARLIGWKLTLHGVPVQGQVTVTSAGGESNRYRSGTPVTLERISGHRDGDSTSCPGEVLYGQLADLRVRAARYTSPLATLTMYTSKTVRGVKASEIGGELRFGDGSSPAGLGVDVEIQAGGSRVDALHRSGRQPRRQLDHEHLAALQRQRARGLPRRRHARADGVRGRRGQDRAEPADHARLPAAAAAPGAARRRDDEPREPARRPCCSSAAPAAAGCACSASGSPSPAGRSRRSSGRPSPGATGSRSPAAGSRAAAASGRADDQSRLLRSQSLSLSAASATFSPAFSTPAPASRKIARKRSA